MTPRLAIAWAGRTPKGVSAAFLGVLCSALGGWLPGQQPEPAPPSPPRPGAQQPGTGPGQQEPGQQEPQQGQQPQQPKPAGDQPQQPAPKPAGDEPVAPPIDETDTAAEALRRLLGLEPGGQLPPPAGDKPADPARPAAGATRAGAAGQQPQGQPPQGQSPQGQQPQGQSPQGQQPQPGTGETERAAEILRRLLPGAETPVTPEPPPAPPQPQARQQAPPGGDPAATSAEGAPRAAAPPLVQGSLRMQYRGRRTGDDQDHDLIGVLSLAIGDPETDAVTGNFVGRGFWDLDGPNADNAFNGLDETRADRLGGYVYEAFADFHRIDGLALARLGRQSVFDTPEWIQFDGVRAETERFGAQRWWFGAYTGLPFHLFESSRRGDFLFGAAFGLEPWQRGRVRFDWMYVQDETFTFDGDNDLLGIQWWQGVGDDVQLSGKHTWLDGDARDLVLRARGLLPATGLDAQVVYRDLLSAQQAQVTEFDPYFPVLGTYQPYHQLTLTLAQPIGETVAIGAGGDIRRLHDAVDEGQFNREYERAWLGPTFDQLLGEDLSLTVYGEYWNSRASGGEDFYTVSGDLRWRWSEQWTGTLGSSYAQFRYDTFQGRENDNVRDYYVRLEHRPSQALRIDGSLAFEDNDFDRFLVFRLGTTWTF